MQTLIQCQVKNVVGLGTGQWNNQPFKQESYMNRVQID